MWFVAMVAAAMAAASGCTRLANLYPPAPPPQVGALSLVPSDLDFGAQRLNSTSRSFVFVLTNPPSNDGAALITEVGTSGPPFEIDTGSSTCAAKTMLPVGGHCQIGVKFAPTAPGRQTGTIAITDNAANSPQVATLEGLGR
jgi:hypothetical protein